MPRLVAALAALPLSAAAPTGVDPVLLAAIARRAERTVANHPGKYPIQTHEDWDASKGINQWEVTASSSGWTVGFMPQLLWQLYNETGEEVWRTRAQQLTAGIAPQQNNTGTHDVGFMVFGSFGSGIELGGMGAAYTAVVLRAAESLATRYSAAVGCTQSWGSGHHCRLHADYTTRFPVIIDNMMNLELLFWSAAHGGPTAHYDIALSHARRTAEHHIRADGSTYHVVDYDPSSGAVARRCTAQGWLDNSTWSRGQAWCVTGFTAAYRYTGDAGLLAAARRCADYYIGAAERHDDVVPLFDFDWPTAEPSFRDVTAAAIAATGLAELAGHVGGADGARYRSAATALVSAMNTTQYLGAWDETEGILKHGMGNCAPERSASGTECGGSERDVSIVYGGTFLLQALRRLAASAR